MSCIYFLMLIGLFLILIVFILIALNIVSIEANNEMPVEGGEFSVACKILGSSSLEVIFS